MSKRGNWLQGFVLIAGLFITLMGVPVLSQAEEVLPPGLVIGDDTGLYASSTGDYFVDLPEVVPGEVYTKEITIRSLEIDEPFELGLLVSEHEASGTIDFNEAITMTLTLDGVQLYQGPLLGDGSVDWTLVPLELGTCSYGTDMILEARFEVSSGLTTTDYQEASELLYHWTFVAIKKQVEPPASSDSTSDSSTASSNSSSSSSSMTSSTSTGTAKPLPSTGEDTRDMVYKMLIGLLLILFVLVAWKKKKREEENE